MTTNPKPVRESRVLRFSDLLTWLFGALMAIPSLISYACDLLGDPQIAAAVSDAIPAKYRAALAIIVIVVAQRYKALRMTTSAPIAERWLATDEKSEKE